MKFLLLFYFAVGNLQLILATIEVLQPPITTAVVDGQNHTLVCRFNQNVNCKWQRNGMATTISGRYHFISNNGSDTTDCSIQITNITSSFDIEVWRCQGNDLIDPNTNAISNEASLYANVPPSRTAIMLNGIPVTEIWVPKNGSENGTLACVAENARPKALLSWSFVHGENGRTKRQIENTTPDCYQNISCTTTLPWLDHWKDLTNRTHLTCIVRQGNDFYNVLNATIRLANDGSGANCVKLHSGTIASALLVMIVIMLRTCY